MPSFDSKKGLRVMVTLGSGGDTITLEGFRTIVEIDKAGGQMMSTLRARIYGVRQADMNAITTLQWKPKTVIPNTVQIVALDGDAETLIFAGNIVNAWGDYNGMPDVFLQIQAQAGFYSQLKAVAPRSFKGGVSVATVMEQIASSIGHVFENNGVNVQLQDVYLANTDIEQAKELARAAGIGLYIDDTVLAITPDPYTPRESDVPVISSATGLIGYPTFDGVGVNFQALFNPAVTFGGKIQLQTDVSQAAGQWVVTSVAYRLESERPGGAWFMTIRGNQNGLAVTRG